MAPSVLSGPANGSLTLGPDGGFTYTPAALFTGLDSFTYVVSDGNGGTASASVQIFVDSTLVPQGLYLGTGAPTASRWPLVSDPLPPSPITEPDHDADGEEGLTIRDAGQKLDDTDPGNFQHWFWQPTTALALRGPVTLDLWSTVADFEGDEDMDYSAWLLDCDLAGADCQVITSTVDVHIDEWNGGTEDWVRRTLPVGSADHVILPGRSLELRLMVDHDDAWVSMSGTRASRLDLTLGNATPLAQPDSFSVLEDSGANTLDVLANDVDSNLDQTSVTIVTPALLGTATAESDGTVTYTPTADANGDDALTYLVCDLDGVCVTGSVTVVVTAVNDAPSFIAGSNITVPFDDGSQKIDLWATSILTGPADEDGQQVTFVVTNDDNAVFETQPAIDEDGDLTFESAAGASGVATVTVVLADDGGTADGGVDSGAPVTFLIEILPP